MTMPILEVRGLSKSYRSYHSQFLRFASWFGADVDYVDHWVLRDISFSVRSGESIGILGRNGAGKSTLLKMIAGTLAPTTGEVLVSGKVNAILELGMGFNQEFTARENVLHACGLMGHDRKAIEDAMPAIEAFADIGEYFDQPVRAFSSGMMVRVAFAAATAFRPDILIVDEALSVGDLSFQAKCFERIAQLKASGTTLIYVSHAVTEVVKYCERCIYIKDRTLALDGPSRDVSNVYLDDLFGRNREATARPAEEEGREAVIDPFIADGAEDVFFSRPGYRKEEYRWGQGGVRVLDFHLEAAGQPFPQQIRTGCKVSIKYRVFFERDVERPVFGLLIKSHEGLYLYGTNSALADGGFKQRVSQGNCIVASFELPWHFNEGTHLLSFGVSEQHGESELVPLDRRYDSVMVHTINERKGSGMLDLGASFTAKVEVRK